MRRYLFATVVLVMLGTAYALGEREAADAAAGQGSAAPAGKAYRFEKLADGVYFAADLRDFWRQASELRAQGLTAAQAAERMDLSKFAPQYGARVGRPDARAVLRAYELLQIQIPM